jgi:hypothetical protein
MESCVSAQVDYNSHESRIVSDGRSAIKMRDSRTGIVQSGRVGMQGLGLIIRLLAVDGLELNVTRGNISEGRHGERRGYARMHSMQAIYVERWVKIGHIILRRR